MIRKAIFFMICLVLSVYTYTGVYAQVIEPDDIIIDVIPEIPEPGEIVTINLTSYSFDINTYFIEWIEGNEIKLSGYGKRDYQFLAGKIGETKTVKLVIRPQEGGSVVYTKQFVSKPSGLDILWQTADTYTPPFYRGKALPSTESIVKIIALPTFQTTKKTVTAKDAVYSWKRNFETMSGASGYGKNIFSIKKSYLTDEETIQVTASEPTEGSVATGDVLIKTYPAKIIFYKKDPLFGIDFTRAITTETTLGKTDTTLLAIPYFLSPKNILDNDLTYTWSLNGSEIGTPAIKNQIVLRGSDTAGTAKLDLLIESLDKLFLSVKKTINLNLQEYEE